jgi:tetratricopeptide (TPR) repeat protein
MEGGFAEMSAVLGLEERTERSVPDIYMELARALLAEARGDLDEARAAAEAAMQASNLLRAPTALPQQMVYLAGIERRAGNRQQAASLYGQATDEWERGRGSRPPNPALRGAAQFALEAVAQGDASAYARCRETLEQHRGLVAVNLNVPVPILVDRALGVIAAAEGQWKEAVAYLDSGEAFCKEKGLVVELAHCRMALADALMHRNPATGVPVDKAQVSDGDRRRATALYAQALADYQRLGMPLYVQDVLARREVLKA